MRSADRGEQLAVRNLAAQPASPGQQTQLQQLLWKARTDGVPGLNILVPPCPYSAGELSRFAAAGRRVAYLPPTLATQHNRYLLGELFAEMRCYAVAPGNQFPNVLDGAGWFDYPAGLDCEYRDTDEAQLSSALEGDGRRLLSLNEYIVASQDSRVLSGRYLDERRTWSRVGCTIDGRIIAVRFDGAEMAEGLGDEEPAEGSLLIGYDIGPDDHGEMLGARTTSGTAATLRSRDAQDAWDRIAARYVEAGFPAALGLTSGNYLASLPPAPEQPQVYRGRFEQCLLVETRLPWTTQAHLLGIALSFDARRGEYWPVDDRSAPPAEPYVGWFGQWGHRFADPVSPGAARSQLRADEVGAGPCELIAMATASPDLLLAGRFFEAIGYYANPMELGHFYNGSSVLRTPCMYHWRGKPEIGANLHPYPFAIFRPLVRGERVNVELAL